MRVARGDVARSRAPRGNAGVALLLVPTLRVGMQVWRSAPWPWVCHLGIDHLVPGAGDPELLHWLNVLRTQAREVVMIGHKGHPEVEGTMGQSADGMFLVETVDDVGQLQVRTPQQLAYVTQTTLSVDDAASIIAALKERFPEIQGPKKDDICYATQSRQDAVKEIAESCDVAIIVGSTNSSNSNRLREVAQKRGVQSYLVDSAAEIDAAWLAGKSRVGISAGASAPEILVSRVMARIAEISPAPQIVVTGVEEQVFFPLPKELQTV